MPICQKCNNEFPNRILLDNKVRILSSRKFCISCSPFGKHNTIDITKYNNTINSSKEKVCSCCNKNKNIIEFYKKPNGKCYSYCKECTNTLTIKRQRQNKKLAIDYKGGKCSVCGYDKCDAALDFHHIDPTKKDFNISHHKGMTLENLKEELDKCILVCRNCHAELHNTP